MDHKVQGKHHLFTILSIPKKSMRKIVINGRTDRMSLYINVFYWITFPYLEQFIKILGDREQLMANSKADTYG